MEILSTVESLENRRDQLAARAAPVAIVPTMGALHEGHLSLIDRARELVGDKGQVLVTIFVNPLQFDKTSDLDNYPVTLETDLAACEARGADVVFTPAVGDLYADDRSVIVREDFLSKTLCGATRAGHFDGVCTVVLKLFLLSGADYGVFGEKDFQQLAIIRRLVRDLNVNIKIEGVATAREPDGLAMSSRNKRLTQEQRADAARIRKALLAARKKRDVESMMRTARECLEGDLVTGIDYLEVVDAETLQPVSDLGRPAVLATAVFYGDVRLIDHVSL